MAMVVKELICGEKDEEAEIEVRKPRVAVIFYGLEMGWSTFSLFLKTGLLRGSPL